MTMVDEGGEPSDGPAMHGGIARYHRPRSGAPRVVFVHGSMDRAASFVKVTRRLSDVDALRYDRRGYGRSLGAAPADTVEQHVADLLEVLDGVPSVVVGHSLGGVIALAAAQREPTAVRGLVVFEAPMPWAPWWPSRSAGGAAVDAAAAGDTAAAAERFMRRMLGDERWQKLPPSTREARRTEGVSLVRELRAMREGPVPYDLERVTGPLVVGYGTQSDLHQQRAARELAATVAGAELHAIDGAAHGAHASHPDAFAALVRRALALT